MKYTHLTWPSSAVSPNRTALAGSHTTVPVFQQSFPISASSVMADSYFLILSPVHTSLCWSRATAACSLHNLSVGGSGLVKTLHLPVVLSSIQLVHDTRWPELDIIVKCCWAEAQEQPASFTNMPLVPIFLHRCRRGTDLSCWTSWCTSWYSDTVLVRSKVCDL